MVDRTGRAVLAGALMGWFFVAGPAGAAPVVPAFERFGRTDGQVLLGELNCVVCHASPATTNSRPGPVLDQVGQRARVGYLRRFLRDPHQVKPGTLMPQVFADDPERDAKVEALVQFLATTGTPRQDRPDGKLTSAGRDLYHKVGCVACHGSRDDKGQPAKTTPATVPLVDLKSKYTISSLAAF